MSHPGLHHTKSGVNLAGVNCNDIRVHPNALETACQWLKHVICPIWIWEAVWGGSQPQPWCYDIIHNPQVTWFLKSGANWPVTWYVCTHMALRQRTSSSSNTLYGACGYGMWEVAWDGSQFQLWRYDIVPTPQGTWIHKSGCQLARCNGIRVHPNAIETAYQWLKHSVYGACGCGM